MLPNTYIFEQPLNERIRMFLRIEDLIHKLDLFKSLESDIASYQALLIILEITSLVERGDIKQEILKELERQHKALNLLASHESVDKSRLELTLSKLKTALNSIHGMDGKLGEHLKRIDFLLTIKQRASIPGGSCDFDLPQLRYWLNLDYNLRLHDIERWSKPYNRIHEVLALILNIIRDSAHPEIICAQKGFFQEPLDTSLPNQMLRIEMPIDSGVFPEISAGKHRYSIRFLKAQKTMDQIPSQFKEDIEFNLFRCTL
jgi:cell division protein ZapD